MANLKYLKYLIVAISIFSSSIVCALTPGFLSGYSGEYSGTPLWGAELLTNGDFEDLTGWTPIGTGQVSSLSTDNLLGTYAGKYVTDGIDVDAGFKQAVSVDEGETYLFEGWGRALNNTTSSDLFMRIMVGTTTYVKNSFSIGGNTDYRKQQIIYTVPVGITSFDLVCGAKGTPDIDGYCDGFSVRKRSAPLPHNVVITGGFENGSNGTWTAQANMSIVTDEARSGLFSRYLDSNGADNYFSKQDITLIEGETYRLSAWFKIANYVTGNPAYVQVVCDGGTVLASSHINQNTNGWEYDDDTWVHPSGCVGPVVAMFSNVSAQADTWFDDIKVEKQ